MKCMGTVHGSNTEKPGRETGPCTCNPKPLSGSLHLLNETVGLQLFLEKLQGQEEAVHVPRPLQLGEATSS